MVPLEIRYQKLYLGQFVTKASYDPLRNLEKKIGFNPVRLSIRLIQSDEEDNLTVVCLMLKRLIS